MRCTINEWSSFVPNYRGIKLDKRSREKSISQSDVFFFSRFTVNLELVCNTLHISHINAFTTPVTANLICNTSLTTQTLNIVSDT